jgi:hypothetical protein
VAEATVKVLMTKMARVRVKQQEENAQVAKEQSDLLAPVHAKAANQAQVALAA